MEDLITTLKQQMIEVLNLEEMTPEDIDTDAPCSATDWGSTPSMPWN